MEVAIEYMMNIYTNLEDKERLTSVYHERVKKNGVKDICRTLTNTVEEGGVLIDRGNGTFIGSFVDN